MEKLTRLMDCPVCYDRLSPPVSSCINGHVVCQKCRNSLEKCPTCRNSFAKFQMTFLNQLIEAIPINCKYASSGCSKAMVVTDMLEHEKLCNYANVECFVCSQTILYRNLQHHILTTLLHFAKQINFGEELILERKGLGNQSILCFEKNVQLMFCLKCIIEHDKGNIIFCVQFLGDRENAKKYLYRVRFHQGQTLDFNFGGFCLPYYSSDAEMVMHPDVVPLKIEKIFLDKKLPYVMIVSYHICKSVE